MTTPIPLVHNINMTTSLWQELDADMAPGVDPAGAQVKSSSAATVCSGDTSACCLCDLRPCSLPLISAPSALCPLLSALSPHLSPLRPVLAVLVRRRGTGRQPSAGWLHLPLAERRHTARPQPSRQRATQLPLSSALLCSLPLSALPLEQGEEEEEWVSRARSVSAFDPFVSGPSASTVFIAVSLDFSPPAALAAMPSPF
jgi:hypothetical protein